MIKLKHKIFQTFSKSSIKIVGVLQHTSFIQINKHKIITHDIKVQYTKKH